LRHLNFIYHTLFRIFIVILMSCILLSSCAYFQNQLYAFGNPPIIIPSDQKLILRVAGYHLLSLSTTQEKTHVLSLTVYQHTNDSAKNYHFYCLVFPYSHTNTISAALKTKPVIIHWDATHVQTKQMRYQKFYQWEQFISLPIHNRYILTTTLISEDHPTHVLQLHDNPVDYLPQSRPIVTPSLNY
jgi:hypothetical protein